MMLSDYDCLSTFHLSLLHCIRTVGPNITIKEPIFNHLKSRKSNCSEDCDYVYYVRNLSNTESQILMVCQNLLEESKSWQLYLESCRLRGDKLFLSLNRTHTFNVIIGHVANVKERFGHNHILANQVFTVEADCNSGSDGLRELRVQLVAEAMSALGRACGGRSDTIEGQIPPCTSGVAPPLVRIIVSSKSTLPVSSMMVQVVVAAVSAGRYTPKEKKAFAQKYKLLRMKDMQTFRGENSGVDWATQENVADAAVRFDLLSVNPAHTVVLNDDDTQPISARGTCNRGAANLLYNYARFCSLLDKFHSRVQSGDYGPLPPLQEINFSLLNHHEEWTLLLHYIATWPAVVKKASKGLMQGKSKPHWVIGFLFMLSATMSSYYRNVRILTDARRHLMPVLYARIHLITALVQVIKNALSIFSIQPNTRM